MKPSPEHDEQLEQLVHRALHDLPPRRAPRTLEDRVLAALANRPPLPWWRQNQAHWPAAVRGVFFFGTAALAAGLVFALFSMSRAAGSTELAAQAADGVAWLAFMGNLGRTAVDAITALFRAIPTLWLYGGLAALVAAYVTLIGVGAAAYRTFRPAHS